MHISRTYVFVAMVLIAAVEPAGNNAYGAALSLVGPTTTICQLIGETDWASGQPTAARTLSNFGLDAVDLGFPVDSGKGRLYLLFGDSIPNGHPPGSFPSVPPDDALGLTTRTAVPDSKTCLDLQLALSAPKTFAHPTVHPPIQQGSFNVPTGGVFFDDKFYAFFWTDHCVLPTPLLPDPSAPLTRPPASPTCPEIPVSNSIGRSVLAQATPTDPSDFNQALPLVTMPNGFVYVSAAKADVDVDRHRDGDRPHGIPVFGAARYRASIPYLAIAPRETFADPGTWSFFAGRVGGHPYWVTRAQWESGHNTSGEWVPPAGAEIYDDSPLGQRCVGEHSVTWNAELKVWLLLNNCVSVIEARFARDPWGPWSPPIVLLDSLNPAFACTLLQTAAGCLGLRNYWNLPGGTPWPGFFYAPFVLTRFTRDAQHDHDDAQHDHDGEARRVTIYWLVSTWNPYTVVVMRSTLELK